ncbi:MAG: acyl-CoA/acyl-ACP dehydrogenase [Chloroflexi bacterium]|nr:acyl-CoA/acyl-ACP dehydrogenase [Chloroflexota bacterium]MBI3930602.1 acyl-CoA/acyl-ACP dehydrogenase [Chloroflexota bacterium]
MNLDFTEEQKMLRTMARDFLSTECPKSLVRQLEESDLGYSPEIWKKMAGLGWQGIMLPEDYGGTGMTFFDLVLVIEEMGHNILPGPFFSTVICAATILEAGTEEQKREFLPKVSAGEMILTLALTEPSASWQPQHISVRAAASGENYVINGTKLFVPDAHVANYLLVVTRTKKSAKPEEGITIFLVDAGSPGIQCEPQLTMGLDNKSEVVFENVAVPRKNILGKLNQGWTIVQSTLMKAAAAKVAEMSGGCQASLEMTADYVKEREAYGHPIGGFQAIQHYLADMWGYTDRTKSIAWEVNWKVSAGMATALDVAIAKAWANEAYKWVTERAVQCHGAIGTTRDHDIGLYYRRAKVAELDYGDTDYQKEIVAGELGF